MLDQLETLPYKGLPLTRDGLSRHPPPPRDPKSSLALSVFDTAFLRTDAIPAESPDIPASERNKIGASGAELITGSSLVRFHLEFLARAWRRALSLGSLTSETSMLAHPAPGAPLCELGGSFRRFGSRPGLSPQRPSAPPAGRAGLRRPRAPQVQPPVPPAPFLPPTCGNGWFWGASWGH